MDLHTPHTLIPHTSTVHLAHPMNLCSKAHAAREHHLAIDLHLANAEHLLHLLLLYSCYRSQKILEPYTLSLKSSKGAAAHAEREHYLAMDLHLANAKVGEAERKAGEWEAEAGRLTAELEEKASAHAAELQLANAERVFLRDQLSELQRGDETLVSSKPTVPLKVF